jgi:hypothetical protein
MGLKLVNYNPAQNTPVILHPRCEVTVAGRGQGKSAIIGHKVHLINTYMPQSVTSITGKTFGQLLTRTLPSTFKFLESYFGYVKNVHYVINRKPPDHFRDPFERILKHDNYVSFLNGTGYLLLSQDRAGSSRGPNTDYEIGDEFLTIDKERYDQEVSPTNRGNLDKWGVKGNHPVSFHHGFHFVSSMPYSAAGRYLLEFGNYYETEAGIRIFDTWNRIVKLQLQLLEITDHREFAAQWNEIARIKKQIAPFVSKDGLLFTLSNAFDNLDNVGLEYIKREYQKLTNLIFMIEIMNWIPDKVEDCYYNIDPDKHVYYESFDNGFIRDLAEDSDWDFTRLGRPDSRFDSDCDTNQPLEMVIDWGSNISFMLICQESCKVRKDTSFNFLKEFFVKPEKATVMIDSLIDEFVGYYNFHNDRTVIFWRDKYGDERLANSSDTYNTQAINRLEQKGWNVVVQKYRGKEPPVHEKYLLWGNILKENNPLFPVIRINGNNCKYFLIAAQNTRVIERDNKFKKDKSSENTGSNIPPEEATHSTDAADKIVWYRFFRITRTPGVFVPARI